MRFIRLYDQYFLILMIIQGFVVAFIDSRRFKSFNMSHTARKAKVIGIASIGVAFTLYLITRYIG